MVIAALFDGSKTDLSFKAEGKRLGFAESLLDTFKKYPQYLEKCTQYQLQKWRKIILESGLKSDHELIILMNSRIKKIAKPFLDKPEEGKEFRKFFPPYKVPFVMQDHRTLDQPRLSLMEVKAFIEKHGSEVEEITLYEVNDEIVEIIREKCPKIFFLKIAFWPGKTHQITSMGLKSIGQMPLLEIDFDFSSAPFIAPDALQYLFSQPSFKKNVKKIKLKCPSQINDELLREIGQYKELVWLELSQVFGSQWLKLLSQSNLPKSLKVLHLSLAIESILSEKEVKLLALFQQLTSLHLNCKWDQVGAIFVKFNNLKEIKLKYINRSIIDQLPLNLEIIEFKECQDLSTEDYDALFSGRHLIRSLTLKKCGRLEDENVTLMLPLRLEKLHLEGSSIFKGLDGLFLQMRNCLRSVALIQNPLIPSEGYASIGRIEMLHTLRVGSAPKFNQISMEGVFNLRVQAQLRALSLREVSMTEGMVLTRIAHIEALELAGCYALGKNIHPILSSVTFQNKLRKLMLDGFSLKSNQINQFDKLELFYGGNSDLKEVSIKGATIHLYDGDK